MSKKDKNKGHNDLKIGENTKTVNVNQGVTDVTDQGVTGENIKEGEEILIEKDAVIETEQNAGESAENTNTVDKGVTDQGATDKTEPPAPNREDAALDAGQKTNESVENTNTVDQGVTVAPDPNAEKDANGNAIPEWYRKQQASIEKTTDLKEQGDILANSIINVFAEREKTSFPKLTEKDVRLFAKHALAQVTMYFVFENDEKTKGYINITEFGKTQRVPVEGSFNFGIDYSID